MNEKIKRAKLIRIMGRFGLSPEDFESPDLPGSWFNMQLDTMIRFGRLQERVNYLLLVSSGFRTPKHNEKVGGTPGSSHLKGYAIDVLVSSQKRREEILREALQVGFFRFGVYSWGLHLDDDVNKQSITIWTEKQVIRI